MTRLCPYCKQPMNKIVESDGVLVNGEWYQYECPGCFFWEVVFEQPGITIPYLYGELSVGNQ